MLAVEKNDHVFAVEKNDHVFAVEKEYHSQTQMTLAAMKEELSADQKVRAEEKRAAKAMQA